MTKIVRGDKSAGGTPPEPTIDQLATRGAEALLEMRPVDRDAVMAELPGRVKDIAQTVVGGALDNALLGRSRKQLQHLIEQGTTPIAAATTESADRIADLRSALSAEGEANARRLAHDALANIAHAAGATPADFERLVKKLELLTVLKGDRVLAQLHRDVRAKVYSVGTLDLGKLAENVGHALAKLAYEPVDKLWRMRTS